MEANPKMNPSNPKLDLSRPGTRLAVTAGAVALIAAAFAAGYGLGTSRPGPDDLGMSKAEIEALHAQAQAPTPAPQAGSLEGLVAGLEKKVAANPNDLDQQLLLAQTYHELGQRDKAVKLLRTLRKKMPQDSSLTIILATTLMDGDNQTELREAFQLFDEAVRQKPAVVPMARLYQGDILVKLGDNAGALKLWNEQLKKTAAGDPARAMYEEKIARASTRR